MAKPQYNPKNFFRQVSNALFQTYFHNRGLLTQIDFTSLDESDIDQVYDAWLELSHTQRAEIEEDFQAIDLLADGPGILAILEESRTQGYDAEAKLADLAGFHDKAFWSFLHLDDCFETALRFRSADCLPTTYWRERNGIADITPLTDEDTLENLGNVLKLYFLQEQGRGHNC